MKMGDNWALKAERIKIEFNDRSKYVKVFNYIYCQTREEILFFACCITNTCLICDKEIPITFEYLLKNYKQHNQ